jgi:hypothetical protein
MYTPEQIELCKQLYELGEKREPEVGEKWGLVLAMWIV